jgi:hypothetical protein
MLNSMLDSVRNAEQIAGTGAMLEPQAGRPPSPHPSPVPTLQALALNKHIQGLGSGFQVDAVVVSPLTRTLETAAGVFGRGRWQEGDAQLPLMVAQVRVEGGSL